MENQEYIKKRKKLIYYYLEAYKYSTYIYRYRMAISDLLEEKKDINEAFCTPEYCKNCKGNCCKTFPCAFSPMDFIDITDMDYMKSILDIGLITISRQASLPFRGEFFYELRMRGKEDKGKIVNTEIFTTKNPCLLLDEKGCMLDANYRPMGGLLGFVDQYQKTKNLDEPYKMEHIILYDSSDQIKHYRKYQDIMKELIDIYSEKISNEDPNEESIKKLQMRIRGELKVS